MKIHIFDIDHTLIKQSTARIFLREALKRKLITLPQLIHLPLKSLLYKYALIDPQFIEKETRILADYPEETILEVSREAFNNFGRDLLFIDGILLIRKLQAKEARILFATSSFDVLIQPVLHFFGLKESVATRLEFVDGKTTGRTLGDAPFGENKKRAVEIWLAENQIPLESTCFYSDSFNDLPLLKACGEAVAVNPDHRLHREAKKQGWQILRFRKTLG